MLRILTEKPDFTVPSGAVVLIERENMESALTFQHSHQPVQTVFGVCIVLFIAFVILISITIAVLIWCRIFHKAGYCWALGLLMLLPIVNIIMPFVLAFGDWPIQKELRQLKQQQNNPPGQP